MESAPIRPITTGPMFHWFGYYDKLQFSESNNRVLSMEVGFEGRSPRPGDTIKIGVINLDEDDRWTELGTSRAWCWQQGCMLQWVPRSESTIIWNDMENDRYVSHVMDLESGEKRTLPRAIYTLSPDGRTAVTTDYRRINDMRPGYGYAGIPDPNKDILAPDDTGIWRVDLVTGHSELIISIADAAGIPYPHANLSEAKHYFNHLLVNPLGTRFIFLHRWRFGDGEFETRMLTANLDGSDIRVVDDSGNSSHFWWRDADSILIFTEPVGRPWAFYLFNDSTGAMELVLDDRNNGHCVYLQDTDWILNDTYPIGDEKRQHLYLYHVPTHTRVPLGTFPSPREYDGEWRCDLHPRVSRDGKRVTIDSAHAGHGRQQYLIDLDGITTKLLAPPT